MSAESPSGWAMAQAYCSKVNMMVTFFTRLPVAGRPGPREEEGGRVSMGTFFSRGVRKIHELIMAHIYKECYTLHRNSA